MKNFAHNLSLSTIGLLVCATVCNNSNASQIDGRTKINQSFLEDERKHKMADFIFITGSARKESYNKKLAQTACDVALSKGVKAKFIDLGDYPMPLYHGDEEAEKGLPENAVKLKHIFASAKGIFIASPEYNSGITPLLKNTIDWLSRPDPEGKDKTNPFSDKVIVLGMASPGALGGIRAGAQVRLILTSVGCIVLPQMVSIKGAFKAFDGEGALVEDGDQNRLDTAVTHLIDKGQKLS